MRTKLIGCFFFFIANFCALHLLIQFYHFAALGQKCFSMDRWNKYIERVRACCVCVWQKKTMSMLMYAVATNVSASGNKKKPSVPFTQSLKAKRTVQHGRAGARVHVKHILSSVGALFRHLNLHQYIICAHLIQIDTFGSSSSLSLSLSTSRIRFVHPIHG